MGAGRRPQEAQATRAIRARGGSTSIVSKSPRPQVGLITPPAGPTPSTRQLSFAIIRREEDRTGTTAAGQAPAGGERCRAGGAEVGGYIRQRLEPDARDLYAEMRGRLDRFSGAGVHARQPAAGGPPAGN